MGFRTRVFFERLEYQLDSLVKLWVAAGAPGLRVELDLDVGRYAVVFYFPLS